MSQVVILSKEAACTSQHMELMDTRAFMDVWHTLEQALIKQIIQLLPVVLWQSVCLFMELLIHDENYYLPLCVYEAGFGKANHILFC